MGNIRAYLVCYFEFCVFKMVFFFKEFFTKTSFLLFIPKNEECVWHLFSISIFLLNPSLKKKELTKAINTTWASQPAEPSSTNCTLTIKINKNGPQLIKN